MSKLSVPSGWKKGEPLLISKRVVCLKKAWFIQRPFNYDYAKEDNADDIACIWFFTLDEFQEFMQWWHS